MSSAAEMARLARMRNLRTKYQTLPIEHRKIMLLFKEWAELCGHRGTLKDIQSFQRFAGRFDIGDLS